MPTWTALLTCPDKPRAEAIGAALEELVPAPVAVAVTEIEDGSGLWEVGGYFEAPPDRGGLALIEGLHGAGTFVLSKLEDRDWVAQVQRELTPVEAGRFTIHGRHDAGRVGFNRVGLRIEAAMAFGTGHHGTTRGCLLLLEDLIRQGQRPRRVADIGCGTGVLAMAAAKAWHCATIAADIDPIAAMTARANLAANGVLGEVLALTAPGFRAAEIRRVAPFDLIFANILAAPLKRLAPDMARHLAPGGWAILSGLLVHQAPGVIAVYRGHGLYPVAQKRLGDWTSLLLRC